MRRGGASEGERGSLAEAPPWFEAALAQRPERTAVTVDEVELQVLSWGRAGSPAVLLMHGFQAHADWWSFTAPLLAPGRRVVAFSFSGMGRSGWRSRYSMAQHAREAIGVAAACRLFEASQPPVFVGHSYGSFVARLASRQCPAPPGGAILIDGVPYAGGSYEDAGGRRHRVFASRAEAMARFRFSPPQPCENDFIVDHLARTSLGTAAGVGGEGWSWCFDPDLLARTTIAPADALLEPAGCRMAVMFGERSIQRTPERIESVRRAMPEGTPWVVIPGAGHHVMADEPLALVAALHDVLDHWQRREVP